MLRAIDRYVLSIDRAAPSRDLLLTQASTDGAVDLGAKASEKCINGERARFFLASAQAKNFICS